MIITQKDAIKAIESGETLKRNDGSLVYSLENDFNKLTEQHIDKDCERQFEPYPKWWLDYKISDYYNNKVNKMTAKTVNRLTQKNIWAIAKNIEANIELYTDADYKFIANEMNKIFDYEITIANIQHIKEVTGLQIGRPSKRNSPSTQDDIKYIATLLASVDKWSNDPRLLFIINKN